MWSVPALCACAKHSGGSDGVKYGHSGNRIGRYHCWCAKFHISIQRPKSSGCGAGVSRINQYATLGHRVRAANGDDLGPYLIGARQDATSDQLHLTGSQCSYQVVFRICLIVAVRHCSISGNGAVGVATSAIMATLPYQHRDVDAVLPSTAPGISSLSNPTRPIWCRPAPGTHESLQRHQRLSSRVST